VTTDVYNVTNIKYFGCLELSIHQRIMEIYIYTKQHNNYKCVLSIRSSF